ncbi:MAG TPA: hypothetical protein VHP30_08915 [Ignavibacteriales bacterium]|nr:hypothetical protein [Ignavibacteriales bacterium]
MKYALLFIWFTCGVFAQSSAAEESLDSLVSTEMSFARYSEEHGTNQAFLKFLSDESVMFNPYPVNGKELYAKAEEDSSYLFWTPAYAELSSSCDMGFTYGPWIFKPKKESPDSLGAYGYFLTVWKKEKGEFKVATDGGIRVAGKLDLSKPVIRKYMRLSEEISSSSTPLMTDAENKMLALAKENGYVQALEKFTDEETIVFKNGSEPFLYKENIELIKNLKCEWAITKTETSLNKDLAYAVGHGKFLEGGEFSFFRIWRRGEKDWKIAVDNIRPIKK